MTTASTGKSDHKATKTQRSQRGIMLMESIFKVTLNSVCSPGVNTFVDATNLKKGLKSPVRCLPSGLLGVFVPWWSILASSR